MKTNIYFKLLRDRQIYLCNVISSAKKTINGLPSGHVYAVPHGRTYQYYYSDGVLKQQRRYLPKRERFFAKSVIQREYLEKVVEEAEHELKLLKRLTRCYDNGYAENVINSLPVGKAQLISPIEISDEEYVKQWLGQEFDAKPFRVESLIFENSKGVKMRSKSEIIISDFLDKFNIPYLYEKELWIDAEHCVHPDFTILDVRNRREVYLEHLGMMDNEEYRKKSLGKIRLYEENGITLGRQLIVTYETAQHPLSMKQLKFKLKEIIPEV